MGMPAKKFGITHQSRLRDGSVIEASILTD
jgi:hypothetical protein